MLNFNVDDLIKKLESGVTQEFSDVKPLDVSTWLPASKKDLVLSLLTMPLSELEEHKRERLGIIEKKRTDERNEMRNLFADPNGSDDDNLFDLLFGEGDGSLP